MSKKGGTSTTSDNSNVFRTGLSGTNTAQNGISSNNTTGNTSIDQTNSRQYAPWIDPLQQWGLGTATGLIQNFVGQAPTQALAGFNPDQMKGFDLARQAAQGQFQGNTRTTMDPGAYRVQPQQLGGNDYRQFMNPFLDEIGKATIDTQRRELDNNLAKSGANAANGVSFGGSGAALERAQLARGANQDATSTIANLMSGGFDRATGLASQNVDRRQQAGMANASNALSAYGMQDQFRNSELARQLQAQAGLMGAGNQQQGLAQKGLDIPFEKMQWLMQFMPNAYGSTDTTRGDTSQVSNQIGSNNTNTNTQAIDFQNAISSATGTQPDNSPSTLQQLLGAGLTVGGWGNGTGGTMGGDWLSKLFG